jgi:predicted dinucleotide-binding enzyme
VPFPPLGEPFERLEEAIRICLQMRIDDDGPFEGRHYPLAETLCRPGEANLAGEVLLDIANPLDDSHGMPPGLFVCNTDWLGEQIQRRFFAARVVKALNTLNAFLMVDPGQLAGGDHSVFVAGNDADAKTTVIALLESFGWSDVIDLGGIATARGSELHVALWVRSGRRCSRSRSCADRREPVSG